MGVYQVLLRHSLFKICLVGDGHLKRLKWCVVICPKSQVNCQWVINNFVKSVIKSFSFKASDNL